MTSEAGSIGLCRETSRVPARARQSRICTRLVPAENLEISPLRATQHAHLQGLWAKPSDGLEPSTPSLPCFFWGGTGVHARASAGTFVLQIGMSRLSR